MSDVGRQYAAVMTAFADHTGEEPEGVWVAPGRVNVIGDHTDYNGGLALPIAIDRHVVVAAGRRSDRRLRVRSLQRDEPADAVLDDLVPRGVVGWPAYAFGVAWALLASGHAVGGADLVVDGVVPVGAGLSSSAALECAVGIALVDLYGLPVSALDLAREAQRAENAFVGMPCGLMDQLASTHGRAGHALAIDFGDETVERCRFDLDAHDLVLLVIDTRAEHRLVDGAYADRRAACESAAADLGVGSLRDLDGMPAEEFTARLDPVRARRVRHVLGENQRVREVVRLLRAGQLASAGPLLTASHTSLRDDYEVSSPELDTAAAAAIDAGALGARMTGAGFGGCAVALVHRDHAGEVADTVGRAFSNAGFGRPDIFPAVAVDGARRLIQGEGS